MVDVLPLKSFHPTDGSRLVLKILEMKTSLAILATIYLLINVAVLGLYTIYHEMYQKSAIYTKNCVLCANGNYFNLLFSDY